MTGKGFRQKRIPQGGKFFGLAGVTGTAQVQQHIEPVLVRGHQLRLPQRVQQVMTGEVRHVQSHGRHCADGRGDIGIPAALERCVQPVGQRLQIFIVEAVRHVRAGDPQGVDGLGVPLLDGEPLIVPALLHLLDGLFRQGLVRLLRLVRPAVL